MTGLGVERVGAAIVLTLDRPATHNAIDEEMARALVEALGKASRDDAIRGVVLTGAGDRTFTSGGDLNMLAKLVEDPERSYDVIAMGRAIGAACEGADVPVIAAVQGDAFGGGCELLLMCDLAVVESHARLAFRHAKMGLSPAWGGLTRLVERAGPVEAARLLFEAGEIDAAEAVRLRLCNEVVPKGRATDRALHHVARISENPRSAVAALKRALRDVVSARRADAPELERAVFTERWGGPDHLEAMRRFVERRRSEP